MERIAPNIWEPRGIPSLEPAAFDAVRDNGNAIVVAGPGAGKTELLAQRASYLLETGLCPPPFRILSISFKRDAARNLKDRVALRCGLGLVRRFESYKFDAWAKGLVDRFRLALPAEYRPTGNYAIDPKFAHDRPLRERLLSICSRAGVPEAKIYQLDLTKYFKKWVSGRGLDLSVTVQPGTGLALSTALWESALHSGQRSVLAFPMIGVLAELLLRTNPLLLKALRGTYRYVFLDEFQDTTGSQYRLLHTAFQGSDAVLTAVGDTKQRIMLWAGAQIGVFDAFTTDFSARGHGLAMNYRSAPRLVAIQARIIASLEPASPAPQAADTGLDGEGECRLLEFIDDSAEASMLAELIADWIHTDGVKPADICILVRQLPEVYTVALRQELDARGVESRVQNDFQDLLAEPLATATLDAFRICTRARAPEQWERLCSLTLRLRGYDQSDDGAQVVVHDLSTYLKQLAPRIRASSSRKEISRIVWDLLEFFDEPTFRRLHEQYLQSEFLEQTIEKLAEHLAKYRAERPDWPSTLDAFLGLDCVPIMSIHKSKGLEYHSVILLGLEDYPFRGITSGDGEEDCNFFVAFSRAKKRVIFTSTDVRTTPYGQKRQGRDNVVKFYQLLESAEVPVERIE
jgi:DNA helicase II / ATP-dependent DNA helicase PcrA